MVMLVREIPRKHLHLEYWLPPLLLQPEPSGELHIRTIMSEDR